MSDCIRCGEREAVSGQLGDRCRECLDELLGDGRGPELTLVLSTVGGQTRRLRIREAVEPGVAFALEEAEWTGCAFRVVGREQLDRVEIDGDVWHEADARDGSVEVDLGP
jgi:hypothetical protein